MRTASPITGESESSRGTNDCLDLRRLKNYLDKGADTVGAMSRRDILTDILPGSIVAVAAFTTISWSIAPRVAEATQTAQR
jgi:hypothetical protein